MMFPGATWHKGVDLVAVDRAMSRRGACPELTEQEQRYAIGAMTEAGWSANEISRRLGISARTVTRWRDESRGGGP